MIAIAGAKGGCGKTTTTLGLAAAFARSGVQTLAVDADRQLPDLHVVAGVEREPTVAGLDRQTGWHALAQAAPEADGAHVLPGQKPTENAELDAALEWLDAGATEVLLDCPSGAGPDVVEALAVADGVVVVTTGSDQSLDAAGTTIDIARRLDVPVAGAVFTHCSAVPEAFHARFEVPVLAVVPESASPLTDDEARAEYERAADELAAMTAVAPADAGEPDDAEVAPDRPRGDAATDRHDGTRADDGEGRPDRPAEEPSRSSTDDREAGDDGQRVDERDRATDDTGGDGDTSPPVRDGPAGGNGVATDGTGGAVEGTATAEGAGTGSATGGAPDGCAGLTTRRADLSGLAPGSVAVVEADPASQSEQLLYGLTADRGTLYVSTERGERAVRDALDATAVPVGSPTVRYLTDDAVAETERLVGELPNGSNVVVDATAALERADRDTYREFLNDLKARMLETNSVAVLHCLRRPDTPENRATTEHVADAVFDVESTGAGADPVTVRKFRGAGGREAPAEALVAGESGDASAGDAGRGGRGDRGVGRRQDGDASPVDRRAALDADGSDDD
ncbi:AAA family ATPase [Halosimplex rubrum]|uniref:AAA family ATPase n=1 Tax=Halosimplex rubrum TaxID=869889 RepID=A0A7D5TLF1_9EURY|nr:AAA family ATPase [Halosimplex rubrum]QLH75814.1 AAA family ATPase [Halosimplex rubrum]